MSVGAKVAVIMHDHMIGEHPSGTAAFLAARPNLEGALHIRFLQSDFPGFPNLRPALPLSEDWHYYG